VFGVVRPYVLLQRRNPAANGRILGIEPAVRVRRQTDRATVLPDDSGAPE
jgi:hypothetical protein